MTTSRLDVTIPVISEDVLNWRSAFFVGIKGVGMTSLAVLLQEAGVAVSGADVAEEFVTQMQLDAAGISVSPFESASIPAGLSGVIFSGAHKGSFHPLVQAAKRQGIPCLTLAEAVGSLSRRKSTIVTCGVGGKSTTSAWLSLILTRANWDPAFSVGVGTVPDLGTSGKWGSGDWFVVEGDEYVSNPQAETVSPRFLTLSPTVALCTGVAYDHPDAYASFEDTKRAFSAFWQQIPATGALVVRSEDAGTEAVLAEKPVACQVIRVGSSAGADVRVTMQATPRGSTITLNWTKRQLQTNFETELPGEHNAWNAALVAVTALHIGVPEVAVAEGLREFHSTPRRFEFKGETSNRWCCYDDYAHHPRELAAIAQTLNKWFSGQKVVVAFQPHTFSRTKQLQREFVQALSQFPGEVILLPIFASAREAFDDGITSNHLVQELQEAGKDAVFMENPQELVQYLQSETGPGVFVTLGAGDIYKIYEQLF